MKDPQLNLVISHVNWYCEWDEIYEQDVMS